MNLFYVPLAYGCAANKCCCSISSQYKVNYVVMKQDITPLYSYISRFFFLHANLTRFTIFLRNGTTQSSNVRRKRCTDTNTSEGKQTFNLSICDHLCMPDVFSNINSYQPVELSVILGIVSLCSGLNFIFSFAHHRL